MPVLAFGRSVPMKKHEENQRRRPRQARAQATFDSILEAAVQVIARDGAEGLNTNAVAERAGVSIGTLYQYFPDKDAILLAAARRELSKPETVTAHRRLMEALIRALEFFWAHLESAPQRGLFADPQALSRKVRSVLPSRSKFSSLVWFFRPCRSIARYARGDECSCGDMGELVFGPTWFKGCVKINSYTDYPTRGAQTAAECVDFLCARRG